MIDSTLFTQNLTKGASYWLIIAMRISCWLIIAMFFLLLWLKNKQIGKKFDQGKTAIDHAGISVTTSGDVAISTDVPKILKMFANTISDVSKISVWGCILSFVAAIVSAVFSILP